MRFLREGGGALQLSDGVVATLMSYRQLGGRATEAGGLLLGRHILDTRDVVIDSASEPATQDRRSRFLFWRARQPAQAIVNRAWGESGGVVNYFGEWHTHPEDDPSPSWVDRRSWEKAARRVRVDGEWLFFLIVGIRVINAWEVGLADRVIRPLQKEAAVSL